MQERYSPPRAEYFEGLQTIGEVMDQYQNLAEMLVQEQEARCDPIASTHEATFVRECETPGTQDVEGMLASTPDMLKRSLEPTVRGVQDLTIPTGKPLVLLV